MAKAKPSLALLEMESRLGYKVSPSTYPDQHSKRFCSDLRPVTESTYCKTRREFEEYERQACRKDKKTAPERALSEIDVVETISCDDDRISLTCKRNVYIFNATLDICLGWGFNLALLVTNDEAFDISSVAKVYSLLDGLIAAKLRLDISSGATPLFFRLPREVRNEIYNFALPKGSWQAADTDGSNWNNFIGDPSGFYFPLSSKLTVLALSRQMRQEALPLAYRRTLFKLDDMDDLVKLLVAVGKIVRDNIESLELTWGCRADSNLKWDVNPNPEYLYFPLPTLHAAKCVQLLKQCELIFNISSNNFKADPSIRELCSLSISRVQICDLAHEPIDDHGLAKWLKAEMESPPQEREIEN
ncbi:MAG: hypothetical protein Q9225_001664 [Loekoesia sp. 1 TL-2023]